MSAAELRGALERLHGPLELVPWQSKRADALTRHIENVALMDAPCPSARSWSTASRYGWSRLI